MSLMFDVAKNGHANDGVDEGDKRQESPDIEEGGQRHYQGKQQLSDPLRSLLQMFF
jgi:hypothetical protein